MKFISYILILCFWFMKPIFANTTQMNGTKIMEKVYQEANKHKNKTSNIKLTIIDDENNERIRFFRLKTKISNDVDKSMIKFYEPLNIKGTSLLTHKVKASNETLQWIYFPSFKSLKTISSDEKDQSFMGSDFSYSDIAGRTLDEDTHQLIKQDDKYYYIRSTPKNQNTYSKLDIIVSKENYIAVKISFYNLNDEVFKVLTNEKITKIDGAFEVVFARMKNLSTKGSSIIEKDDINIKTIIKDDEVSIKALSLD